MELRPRWETKRKSFPKPNLVLREAYSSYALETHALFRLRKSYLVEKWQCLTGSGFISNASGGSARVGILCHYGDFPSTGATMVFSDVVKS